MNKLSWLLLAALLSSCSSDWSAGLNAERAIASAASVAASGGVSGSAAAATASLSRRGARSFASAPDRGSLVHYPASPVVRRSGAYTWHAADLSEDHALRSTVTGALNFTAPDGTPINLAYERHVEHPDGNWSWIGRVPGEHGESTVITFGETAAFGTVPQGGDQPPLRLTVVDGRAWVVSADPRLLREIRNEATRPTKPDYFVPPKLAATSGTTTGMQAMGAQSISAPAAGKTVVDVLVGYTSGFSTYRGGAAAAVTRIHNLVDVTNQAHVNSQVNAEIRLVHTLQVSYPDATDNGTALEELTGFQAPSTRTTPAAAFSGLRSARDQYGADLVVLVRRFQDPENDGCGIAWLIGGGQSGIATSDQFFGYSVVSDGQDAGTDGKTYFCREETFAHELGHNMGSQHDSENAKKDDGSPSYGAYAYSFGRKTTTGGGNFFTVMAYGDSGQTSYRVFSNPGVTVCGGFACGVANEADNARSLNQTVATVAGFRANVVPLAGTITHDFNGDGRSDILWRNSSTGANTVWPSGSTVDQQAVTQVANQAWIIAGVGDFDGNGRSDLLWRNTSSGANTIWLSASSVLQRAVTTVANQAWTVANVGDYNGDGLSDILWRNSSNGANTIWLSGNSATLQSVATVNKLSWKIAGEGDFNGDGRSDLLWRNTSTGANTIWLSANATNQQSMATVNNQAWTIADVGDFNGDGRSDLLWRNTSTGANTIWHSGGTLSQQAVTTVANQAWTIANVGDYNGDGRADILWRNTSTGANTIWRSAGTVDQQAVTAVSNFAWKIIGD